MIQHIERYLYEFLKKIMEDKGFNIYRGFLPSNKSGEKENDKKTNDYFPFVNLRVEEFSQKRMGIQTYDCIANFVIWIGTKEEKEENYLNNLAIGDYIRQKLLEAPTLDGGFALVQNSKFKVTFHSDVLEPHFYSKISFSVYAEPIEPNIY